MVSDDRGGPLVLNDNDMVRYATAERLSILDVDE